MIFLDQWNHRRAGYSFQKQFNAGEIELSYNGWSGLYDHIQTRR